MNEPLIGVCGLKLGSKKCLDYSEKEGAEAQEECICCQCFFEDTREEYV